MLILMLSLPEALFPRTAAPPWGSRVAIETPWIPTKKLSFYLPALLYVIFLFSTLQVSPVTPAHVCSSSFRVVAHISNIPTGLTLISFTDLAYRPSTCLFSPSLTTCGRALLVWLLVALAWLSAAHQALFWGQKDR